jgi:hypothetical protein
MSAVLAEALAKIAELHSNLGEAYTELSGHYDAESAKGGKAGNNAAAGKVSGQGNKAAVGPKGKAAAAVDEDDDLPEPTAPKGKAGAAAGKTAKAAAGKTGKAKAVTEDDVRAAAKALIDAKGKDAAVEVLSEYGNGKLADVEESDYPACMAALQAKLDEEDEPAGDANDVDDI